MMRFARSDGQSLLRSVLVGSVTCGVVSLLLQFIGFVTPGWITLNSPTGMTVNSGVWYIQVCIPPRCRTASMTRVVNPFNVAGDNNGWITLNSPTGMTVNSGVWYIQVCIPPRCRTASMTRVVNPFNVAGDNNEDFVNWIELQVETTLAFVCCIGALILAINALVHLYEHPRVYLAWQIVTAVVSGALLLIPVGRLSDVIVGWESHITWGVPYSLICSALGSGFAFLSAVLSLVGLFLVARLKRQQKSQEEQQDLTLAPS